MARLLAVASAAWMSQPAPGFVLGGAARQNRLASASNASCTDAADWQDLDGDNCTVYSQKGWCGQWSQQWAETGSVSASEACCACGGGHPTQALEMPPADALDAPAADAASTATALRGSAASVAREGPSSFSAVVPAAVPAAVAVTASVNVTALEQENEALHVQVQRQEAELRRRDAVETELRGAQAAALSERDKEASELNALRAKEAESQRKDAELQGKDAVIAAKEREIQDMKGLVMQTQEKLRADDARVRDVVAELQNETNVNSALRSQVAGAQNRTASGVSVMRELATRTAEKMQSMDRQISALKAQLQMTAATVSAN